MKNRRKRNVTGACEKSKERGEKGNERGTERMLSLS